MRTHTQLRTNSSDSVLSNISGSQQTKATTKKNSDEKINLRGDLFNLDLNRIKRENALNGASNNVYEKEADKVALQGLTAPANEQGVRDHVGKVLGMDFSSVRVHKNVKILESTGTHAVASGRDISLAPGRYRPDIPLGRALLAHELAHVAQQRATPERGFNKTLFSKALAQNATEYSSDKLSEKAHALNDPEQKLTPAPLGMKQRCVAGCSSCSNENDEGTVVGSPEEEEATASNSANTPHVPTPTHTLGPSVTDAGPKIIRLAWTVDDGPTAHTAGMSTALSPRAATWFIMNNQLGTGTARTNALTGLINRQTAGDEIAIHSMHPTIPHSAWFPINLGTAVPKGYRTTTDAMTDLTTFTGELRTAGLNVHFGRMPGGELSEVKKYVEDQGGAAGTSEAVAQALITGGIPPVAPPAAVATDVALVMSTLRTLNLHLWSGSGTGPEVTRNTWEAESSGVPARTNDVVRRFKGVVNNLASGSRTRPASFVILAHDTTQADVAMADTNISTMETYATAKGVRVEYYRMADLYQILRGSPP